MPFSSWTARPTILILGTIFLAMAGPARADEEPRVCLLDAPRESVAVSAPSLYPEGMDYDAVAGRFLLGSIRQGGVFAVAADGVARPLVQDARLRSVVGIRVDRNRRRVLAVNSDYGVTTRSAPEDKFAVAGLGIYDLESGAPIHFVDLSGLRPGEKRFPNDVAIDADGNAYVTDSLAAAIYKVTPSGDASLFLTDERFRGAGFNLNGVVVHPGGFLLVAQKSNGALYRVPLDRPSAFDEVRLPQPIRAVDGLVLPQDGSLIAMTNRAGETHSDTVFQLRSDDGWASARIVGSLSVGDVYATTGVSRDGSVFFNYGRLNTLPASIKDPKTRPFLDQFSIRQVAAPC